MGKSITFYAKDAQVYVDREYADAPPHQFLRELLKNSIEAGASRVEFTPEWDAVREEGVYRLKVADNGSGMGLEELDKYMATFGASVRDVGIRGNFGIGARMTLLPWNHKGVLILSWSKEYPEGLGMIMRLSENDKGYELQTLDNSIDGYDVVRLSLPLYQSWAAMKSEFIEDYGTVVVCYGNTGHEDTFFGPKGYTSEKGHGLKYIVRYLNERFFDMPVDVRAACFFFEDRQFWPRSNNEWLEPDQLEKLNKGKRRKDVKHKDEARGWQFKIVKGAKYYIYESEAKDKKDKSETVTGKSVLPDRTKLTWAFKTGKLPDNHAFAPEKGFIAALFDGELYERNSTLSMFRSFGIPLNSVTERTYLILEPPPNAFPGGSSRSRLALEGKGGHGSEALPWSRWAEEFYSKLPDFLSDRLSDSATAEYGQDLKKWLQQIEEFTSDKYKRYVRYLVNHGPDQAEVDESYDPAPSGGPSTKGSGDDKPTSTNYEGAEGGRKKPARRESHRGKMPPCSWKPLEELSDEQGRFPAYYMPRNKKNPRGLLLIAHNHPMILTFQNELLEQARPSAKEDVIAMVRLYFHMRAGTYIAQTYSLIHHSGWGMGSIKTELWTPQALLCAFVVDFETDRVLKRRLRHKSLKPPVLAVVGSDATSDAPPDADPDHPF